MPFGVMGGHYQPVGHAWLLTSILDYGLDPQAGIDLARLFAFEGQVEVERGIGFEACEALTRLGHKVRPIDKPHGGGQAIWIDRERGTLNGGSDPRKDGLRSEEHTSELQSLMRSPYPVFCLKKKKN